MSRILAGLCVSVPLVTLYGCGSGDATTTTTTALPKDHACYEGQPISADQCCCLTCGGGQTATKGFNGTQMFAVRAKADCLSSGGQCKTAGTSTFQRPPPSLHAGERCAKDGTNDYQRHLIGGSPTSVQIAFVGNSLEPSVSLRTPGGEATTKTGTSRTYSIFQDPAGWIGYEKSSRGEDYSPCMTKDGPSYTNSSCYYTSELIHRVTVDLEPATQYQYQIAGDSTWVNFKSPPALGSPVVLGFTADLGQTMDSQTTMQHMHDFVMNGTMDAVVFPGDLSYADGAAEYWDTYGRLGDFLWGSIPTAYGAGNHEYTSGNENFQAFLPRYGWLDHELWFSYDTGSAHVIMLCSYCDTSAGGQQLKWLKDDLAQVNRDSTPWVIAAWHTPWYTSSNHHSMAEAAAMRAAYEDTIYKKVDFVVSGHVHAYERTSNVYQNRSDACGPVYITIGDGGNQEGPACGWDLGFPWSMAKENSFGFGTLNITNPTDAIWSWYRNQDDLVQHDMTPITRPSSLSQCQSEVLATV